MQLLSSVEHLALLILVFAVSCLLWLHYHEWQGQSKKKDKKPESPGSGGPNLHRSVRPASQGYSCPSNQSGER